MVHAFANDIVLGYESRAGLAIKLDVWRGVLELKDFHLSRSKTEYMQFNFGD